MALVIKNNEPAINQSKIAVPGKKMKLKNSKTKDAIPKSNRSIAKWYRTFVWSGIIFFFFCSFLALFKATTSARYNSEVISGVQSLKEELSAIKQTNIDDLKVDAYFSDFLPIYFDIESTNIDQKSKREELLGQYFKDTSDLTMNVSGDRSLKNFRLIDVSSADNGWIAKYEVTYTATDNEKKNTQQFHQVINMPFLYENGVFAMTETPYFTALESQSGLVDRTENNLSGQSEIDSDKKEQIQAFLDQFFKNYASTNESDMAYMMQDPESLKGEFEYISSENKVYDGGSGSWKVKSEVTFQLPKTSFMNTENMTLSLVQKDGKYFVENLTHTIGGN